MPTQLHEILLMLFRNRPELAPDLLRQALHVELPACTEVRIESAELSQVAPAEYRADLVVLLCASKPVLGIVVEVQLKIDGRKRYTWPSYVAGLRARFECPCCLLVVTTTRATERWAKAAISIGPGADLVPFVIGPEGVPVVTEPEQAERDPELAVLSVLAHGRGELDTAVRVAFSAAHAASRLDEERRVLYFDLIDSALSSAARKAFAMLPEKYEFRGPTLRRAHAEGKAEGMAEGKAEGKALALLRVLERRGLALTQEQRERIRECRETAQLERWLDIALVAEQASELFEAEVRSD